MIKRKTAVNILKKYGEAWTQQDVAKILSIFHKNGIYHENVFQKPFRGHSGIQHYWQTKVVEEQSKIKFKLLHFWIDGNTLIAEWDASFNSNIMKAKIHIREVAIMEIKSNKIKSLREFWQEEKTD